MTAKIEEDFNFGEDNNMSGEYYKDEQEDTKEIEKRALMEKYDNVTYTEGDRVNLIKKIELYLNDPDLKKISNNKYHLSEYIGKQSDRRNLNKLDGKTLNYIYDELRDININEGLNDMAFKSYLTVNQIMETIILKSTNNKVDVEGYSDALDNNMNRILMKQITVDSFNYFSGSISPQYLLLFNTFNTMTATYSRNKRKKRNDNIKPLPQAQEPPQQVPQASQEPTQQVPQNNNQNDAVKKFIEQNSLKVT
jgi:hypothetical protein